MHALHTYSYLAIKVFSS